METELGIISKDLWFHNFNNSAFTITGTELESRLKQLVDDFEAGCENVLCDRALSRYLNATVLYLEHEINDSIYTSIEDIFNIKRNDFLKASYCTTLHTDTESYIIVAISGVVGGGDADSEFHMLNTCIETQANWYYYEVQSYSEEEYPYCMELRDGDRDFDVFESFIRQIYILC